MTIYGNVCCGSLPKVSCFDGANLCTEESDFSGSITLNDGFDCVYAEAWLKLELASSQGALVQEGSVTGSCYDMYSKPISPDSLDNFPNSIVRLNFAQYDTSCCGSLAKTRCQGGIYTASVPPGTEFCTEFLITLPYTEEEFTSLMQVNFVQGLAASTNFDQPGHGFTKIVGIVPGPSREYCQDRTPDRERDIIFIGTPNLCSPHHRHRQTVILVAACAARMDMMRKEKLIRLT